MDLEKFYAERGHQDHRTWSQHLALMLQPNSQVDFAAHPEFAEIFELFTQHDRYRGMDIARLWAIVLNLKHVLGRCTGSVAELGVYHGQCSSVLSFYARQFHRKMYLADTFQGFDEAQYEADMNEGKKAAFKDASLDRTRAVVGEYAGNRWVIGMFPASVTDEMRDDRYAFVSIDCDIYEPIKEGLAFFWPRMNPGGMVFVHDYSSGHWPGATRAVDEFCAEHSVSGMLLPDYAGTYVLVKYV